MKKILTGILTLFIISSAFSQKMNVGFSIGPAMPIGDIGDALKTGLKFDGSLDYYFNDKFDLGLETGYMTFGFENADGKQNIVPVQLTAGLHTDLSASTDFYAELGGGLFFVSNSFNDESESYGGISPRLGAAFELQEDLLFLDTNVSYTSIFTDGDSNLNLVGVNIGLLYTIN